MGEARFALRDLADPHVGLQWFEAVAVTLGMAEAWPDGAMAVPPFDAYTLSGDGAVRALPGSPASTPPANELGIALQALLVDPAAPQALREAATAAAQAPPGALAAPHLRALAYFERPDRARLLLFLAQRVVPELPEVDPEEELRRLEQRARERAALAKPPGAAERIRTAVARQWRRWRPALPAAVVAALVVAAAWTAYRYPQARTAVTRPLTEVAGWLRSSSSPPGEPAPAAAPAESVAGKPARRAAAASATAPVSPVPPPQDGVVVPAELPPPPAASVAPASTLPPIRNFEMAAPAPTANIGDPATADGLVIEGVGRVFREGDPGVEPARIGRRYLPAAQPQDVPAGRTGVFELVVDEKGQVERVRLLSADNRYQERMLLSAAKAWRFEPARRDGVPVKFLTEVKVTW